MTPEQLKEVDELIVLHDTLVKHRTWHAPGWSPRADTDLTRANVDRLVDLSREMHRALATNPTTGELVMNPGTRLPNGCIVIAASARNAHEWVLLAMKDEGYTYEPYATWKCSRPGDGRDTVSGHYFDDLKDALHDYKTRP